MNLMSVGRPTALPLFRTFATPFPRPFYAGFEEVAQEKKDAESMCGKSLLTGQNFSDT